MSLNGLDDATVKEAYDAAVAEPGGWFLLKYASRDEIELLGRGNGGIVEIRNKIGQYEEPSPLFGFLRYRRRNVVIKYVPDGCSRLVQARVTVHFNAVTEKFAPYHTIFEITTAKELRDTTLSAACSLHTASGSVSSSTSSLRRRRLMEIAEDEEEDIRIKRQSTVQEERPPTAQTITSTSGTQPTVDPTTLPSDLPDSFTFSPMVAEGGNSLETTPPPPRNKVPLSFDLDTSPPPPREPREIDLGSSSSITTIDEVPRKSSQSARPDLYSLASYEFNGKPKVRLGPRPSLDVGKTTTAGGTATYRPVSTLPQGLKISTKGDRKGRASLSSQDSGEPPSMSLSPPSIPENGTLPTLLPLRPHTSGGRPNTSSGASVRSTLSTKSAAPSAKVPTITPEKARLMKAMEMRKRQMSTGAPAQALPASPKSSASTKNLEIPSALSLTTSQGAQQEIQDTLALLTNMAEADKSATTLDTSSALKTDDSDATRSDSYPVSPVGLSEKAESTRASSISELTDETVQEELSTKRVNNDNMAEEFCAADSPEITERGPVVKISLQTPEIEGEGTEEMATDVSYSVSQDTVKDNLTGTTVSNEQEQYPESEVVPEVKSESSEAPVTMSSAQDLSAAACTQSGSLQTSTSEPIFKSSEKSLMESPFAPGYTISQKKKVHRIEPIRTSFDKTSNNSEDNFSSDDELMDELQSAVIEDAKPMSVAKSPVSPLFPPPTQNEMKFSRTVSSPLQLANANPSPLSARPGGDRPVSRPVSASANFLNRINAQPAAAPVIPKKISVGSGVANRIKAFEKFQNLAPESSAAPSTLGPSPTAPPAFFSVKRSTVLVPSRAPSIADRTNSLNKNTPNPNSQEGSPEISRGRERASSIQKRVALLKPTPASELKTTRSRPESVQVTARIIRDPNQPFPQMPEIGKDPSEFNSLALKESPLIIDHQKAVSSPPKDTICERRLSTSSKTTATTNNERRSSIAMVKDLINDRRSSLSERRRSSVIEPSASSPAVMSPSRPLSNDITSPARRSRPSSVSSRRSIERSEFSPPPSSSSTSPVNDDKSDKKSGRASRIMKRMSSSLSSSRKAIAHAISPTVREESEPPVFPDQEASSVASQPSLAASPTIANDLGDVNVQFPDSLLWKRRSMVLDTQGLLIITAGANDKGATRRFHLGEFRAPEIPDVDMQELPNSVVLAFLEGGELQIACEDRASQGNTLNVLREAHSHWAAYGQ
ncbi:21675578-eab8-4398-8af5-5b9563353133 [Sclerotinia trifoliorum]|uniref:21675578-eab8-4398-8af5-5b9563353133 n=1 Tax=Sclerotinia trifoliorum TaxID=28548 RepID=A0A8H2ZKM2_9HELO|nr:21675578-eab8-4398-8af5-5b9563353133 [Sclerotinia trifoliorum]